MCREGRFFVVVVLERRYGHRRLRGADDDSVSKAVHGADYAKYDSAFDGMSNFP